MKTSHRSGGFSLQQPARSAVLLALSGLAANGVIFGVAFAAAAAGVRPCGYRGPPSSGVDLRPLLITLPVACIAVLAAGRRLGASRGEMFALGCVQLILGVAVAFVPFILPLQVDSSCAFSF